MKKSPLSFVLGLTALLGGVLLIPQGAVAHDGGSQHRTERNHYQPDQIRDPQRHYRGGDVSDWYLLRHRELRQHGYRPAKRSYRMKGKKHGHRHHRARSHHDHRTPRRGQIYHSPVQLELSYHIVL